MFGLGNIVVYIALTLCHTTSDMIDLENKLKSAVIEGRPQISRPWKKIIILIEGVYR